MDRRLVGLAVSAALCTGPAKAQLLTELFPGRACYGREYTSTHLASHPTQQVRAIFLRQPDEGGIGLRVISRGKKEIWSGSAVCNDGARRLDCGMEGDMGRFTLIPLGADAVELRVVGPDGISFETDKSIETIGRAGSDDRVFRLDATPLVACPP